MEGLNQKISGVTYASHARKKAWEARKTIGGVRMRFGYSKSKLRCVQLLMVADSVSFMWDGDKHEFVKLVRECHKLIFGVMVEEI